MESIWSAGSGYREGNDGNLRPTEGGWLNALSGQLNALSGGITPDRRSSRHGSAQISRSMESSPSPTRGGPVEPPSLPRSSAMRAPG